MSQRLTALIEQYDKEQVEKVIKVLDRLFGHGYAEDNLDVAAAILRRRAEYEERNLPSGTGCRRSNR